MTKYHDGDSDTVVVGSTNVFADLGIELSEEDVLRIGIARAMSNIISDRKLTQDQAATIIGIDQPKISKVVSGNLQGFSVERLVSWLLILGCDLEVKVKKTPKEKPGRIIFNEQVACC